MKRFFEQNFVVPQHQRDPKKANVINLLDNISLLNIFFSLLATVGAVLGSNIPPMVIALGFSYFLVVVLIRRLIVKEKIVSASFWTLAVGFLMVTTASVMVGTIRSPISSIYTILIIVAGMLMGLTGVAYSTILASFCILGLLFAEQFGLLPKPDFSVSITQWVTLTGEFIVAGGLTYTIQKLHLTNVLELTDKVSIERQRVEQALRISEERFHLISDNVVDVIGTIDPITSKFTYISPSVEKILGYQPSELMETTFTNYSSNPSPQELSQVLSERIEKYTSTRLPDKYTDEIELFHKDGNLIPIEVTSSFVITEAGEIEIVCVLRDISERRSAWARLESSEKRFRAVLENSGDGLTLLDEQFIQVYEGPANTSLTGYIPGELVGLNALENIYPDDMLLVSEALSLVRERSNHQEIREFRLVTKNGMVRWFEMTATNLLHNPDVGAIVVNYHDITERRTTENQLKASEARYRSLFEQMHDAVFIFDLSGKQLVVNDRAPEMLGFTMEEIRLFSFNDISGELGLNKEFMDRLYAGEPLPLYERNLPQKGGGTHLVEISLELVRDESGKPMHIQSVVRDISERRRAEEALRASEAKYRIVADHTFDWEFWLSPERDFIYISPSCKIITGYDPQDFMADPNLMDGIVHPDDEGIVLTHRAIIKYRVKDEIEYRIIHKDGTVRWLSHICQPVFDEKGNFGGTRGSNRDITRRKEMEIEMQRLNVDMQVQLKLVSMLKDTIQQQALRDPLTGLFNRRYLAEIFSKEMSRAQRSGYPISVILADIDHFKLVNDTYGHNTGDEFLQAVANVLTSNSRESDQIYRYGGEEFLLLMPAMDKDLAYRRAEELRIKCSQIRIAYEDGCLLNISISFGVASYPIDGLDMSEVIDKADKALYQSKQKGRDQVTAWQ